MGWIERSNFSLANPAAGRYNKEIRGLFLLKTKAAYQSGSYGALLLVYFYDYGHGAYEELAAVPVPKALSDYFVGLLPDISSQS